MSDSETTRIRHILLAEDDYINRMLAVSLLETRGIRVTAVENGSEAVEAVVSQDFDLVLMDIQMPIMDGLEAARCIRRWEQSTDIHIPIIAVTAHAMPGDLQRCLESGMDGYVAKPMTSTALWEEIERVWARQFHESAPLGYDVFLREKCRGNTQLAGQLIRHLFYKSGPEWLCQLRASVGDGDLQKTRDVCHSIVGTAGNMATRQFVDSARALGQLAREEKLGDLRQALAKLENAFADLLQWGQANGFGPQSGDD